MLGQVPMPVPQGWPVWSVPFTGSMLQKDALSEPSWKCRASKSPCASLRSNDNCGSREGVWLWACIQGALGAIVLAQHSLSTVTPRGTHRRKARKKDWTKEETRVETEARSCFHHLLLVPFIFFSKPHPYLIWSPKCLMVHW